ncbi:MAG TPA: MFS transporter [Candidatus Limnocylindria bacterium]|nr:MFS transporter [Candidatus Limnocylindria bacterium]
MNRPGPDSVFGPRLRGLTAGIFGVVFLVAFEAMAVATAMPVAVQDLDGLPLYGWAFSAFLVTSLFSTVAAGEYSDAHGPRFPLLGGISAFTVGLVVSGLAPTMPVFILGRALQGFGAGGVIVALYVVVARAYAEAQRPQVFALMSAGWVLPSLVGPTVAGALADRASWRLVFLGVPLLVLPAVALVAPWLGRLEGGHGEARRTGRKRAALATAAGVALLQYAGTRLDLVSVLLVLVAAGLLVPTVPRLLPPGTFRLARGLPTTVAMRGFLAAAFFGAETFLPLALVNERGLSTTLAGLCLTGGALGWAAGSFLQGRPGLERPRWQLVRAGALCVALAVAGLATALVPSVPVLVAASGWVVGGFGMGLSMASISLVTMQLSPDDDQGVNSAALQVSDGLFSTVAIVVASTIFAAGHSAPGEDAAVFAAIFAVMACVALAGAAAAPRMRPPLGRHTERTPRGFAAAGESP